MNRSITLGVTVLSAVLLTACSNSGHSSARSGDNKDTSSKVSKTPKKASTDQSKQSSSISQQSSSSTASSSSSSSDGNDQLAAQLTDHDWYVLAYMQAWGAKTPQNITQFPKDQLEFYTNEANGKNMLEQGTVDSSCMLISVTASTVTIGPSTGEGASSQFPNKTIAKADLIETFLPSQQYVTALKSVTAIAEQRGKESQAQADAASSDSSSQQSDTSNNDDQSDSDSYQSSVDSTAASIDSEQENDANQTDSSQNSDVDTDQ